jgi:hypothetical protein
MNRNQKIALGCGGAGCLGLIVVAIAGCLIYYFYRQSPYRASRDYNFNVNINRNSNSNSAANSNSSGSASSSSLSLSDGDKHKLFQAASTTGDSELVRRVLVKMGLMAEDYTPGEKYQEFMDEHVTWAAQNYEFVLSLNTPAKARAYLNEHFPD